MKAKKKIRHLNVMIIGRIITVKMQAIKIVGLISLHVCSPLSTIHGELSPHSKYIG